MIRTGAFTPLAVARNLARSVSGVIPIGPFDRMLARLMRLLMRRHPGVFKRMRDYSGRSLLIVPDEIGFDFFLKFEGEKSSLTASRRSATPATDAVIRGALPGLIGLLEGREDGDALFFSRALTIEGDTALVLALRNAVDGAAIDLIEDLCSTLGPAAGPAEIVLRRAVSVGAGLRRLAGAAT